MTALADRMPGVGSHPVGTPPLFALLGLATLKLR